MKSACHSTMMHHGEEPHQKMYTNVNVSEIVLISFFYLCCLRHIVLLFNIHTNVRWIDCSLLVSNIPLHQILKRFVVLVQQELQVSLCVCSDQTRNLTFHIGIVSASLDLFPYLSFRLLHIIYCHR